MIDRSLTEKTIQRLSSAPENRSCNYAAAQIYSAYQLKLIPVRESDGEAGPAKSPYIKGGFNSASADTIRIAEWWRAFPDAAIGLPCRSNGIIVLDADRHGGADGVANALRMFEMNSFDATSIPVVITPREGRHFIFRRPTSLGETRGAVAPSIDLRDNAYVLAAGSLMANGRRYILQCGSIELLARAINRAALPEPPAWLLDLITKKTRTTSVAVNEPSTSKIRNGIIKSRIGGLLRTVALARVGERNPKLYWATLRLKELVEGGYIQETTAVALLMKAGVHAGLPVREVVATVKSGFGNHQRERACG